MSNAIGWCTHTVNPVVGCLGGCGYCYARGMAARVAAMSAAAKGEAVCAHCRDFVPHLHRERLEQIGQGKKPRRVFIGSMCDLWGEGTQAWWREEIWRQVLASGRQHAQHSYIVLTKRPEEVVCSLLSREKGLRRALLARLWLGVTPVPPVRPEHIARWWGPLLEGSMPMSVVLNLEPLDQHPAFYDRLLALDGIGGLRSPSWVIAGPMAGRGAPETTPVDWWQYLIDMRQAGAIKRLWLKESVYRQHPGLERVQEVAEGMEVGQGVRQDGGQ